MYSCKIYNFQFQVQKLLWLPEELSKLPAHIVEIFLVGIAPCDDEYEWNNCANEIAYDWFVKNLNRYSYIIGEVSYLEYNYKLNISSNQKKEKYIYTCM